MKNFIQPVFQRYWNPYVVLLIAGILSALYFGLTSTVWAVTGEFTRLGGYTETVRGGYFRLGIL